MSARLVVAAALAFQTIGIRATAPPQQSASLAGVVTDESHRPIRRALVTAVSDALPEGLGAITDDDGAFSIAGLPPGRFIITAKKAGYLAGEMGALKPGRPGVPVSLAPGQFFRGGMTLVRTAAMAGMVRDRDGTPAVGIRVFAIDARNPEAPSPSPSAAGSFNTTAITDDRGMYRLYDLPPGAYLICGAYPATGGQADALTSRSTAENDGIFARLRSRGNGVAAGVPDQSQRPPAPSPMSMLTPIFFPGTPSSRRLATTRAASDGVYSFKNLPPGGYLIVALADADPDALRDQEYLTRIAAASVPVTITEGNKTVQDLRIGRTASITPRPR